MDIKCRRTTCVYNKGQTCFASRVDITKGTVCNTFEKDDKKEEDSLDFSKRMFESAPEFANSRHIKNVVLKCNAQNCLFNKECHCRANGITVIDEDDKAKCGSYIWDL